jgi:hypothetical protein
VTHPVIITAPFGIRFNPIHQHGQEFEQDILFNVSITHIDPQCNLPAIRTGHIVLTFISDTIEPVLTNNLPHPNEPIATSKLSSTQPEPDDKLNLLYLTPPPLPASLPRDQYEGVDHKLGMLNEQLPNQPDQVNATSALVDNQLNQLYPTPPLSSTANLPDYNKESEHGLGMSNDQLCTTIQTNETTLQDHNIYYSTTHWPSDLQQYQHPNQPPPMCSWHVQPDGKNGPGGWNMDTDRYSDDSYNYSITSSPRPSTTDWYDQTTHNINYQVKTSTEYDNISTHCPVSQLTTSMPNPPMGWDDHKHNADYELATPVMLTTTPSPLMRHETTLLMTTPVKREEKTYHEAGTMCGQQTHIGWANKLDQDSETYLPYKSSTCTKTLDP